MHFRLVIANEDRRVRLTFSSAPTVGEGAENRDAVRFEQRGNHRADLLANGLDVATRPGRNRFPEEEETGENRRKFPEDDLSHVELSRVERGFQPLLRINRVENARHRRQRRRAQRVVTNVGQIRNGTDDVIDHIDWKVDVTEVVKIPVKLFDGADEQTLQRRTGEGKNFDEEIEEKMVMFDETKVLQVLKNRGEKHRLIDERLVEEIGVVRTDQMFETDRLGEQTKKFADERRSFTKNAVEQVKKNFLQTDFSQQLMNLFDGQNAVASQENQFVTKAREERERSKLHFDVRFVFFVGKRAKKVEKKFEENEKIRILLFPFDEQTLDQLRGEQVEEVFDDVQTDENAREVDRRGVNELRQRNLDERLRNVFLRQRTSTKFGFDLIISHVLVVVIFAGRSRNDQLVVFFSETFWSNELFASSDGRPAEDAENFVDLPEKRRRVVRETVRNPLLNERFQSVTIGRLQNVEHDEKRILPRFRLAGEIPQFEKASKFVDLRQTSRDEPIAAIVGENGVKTREDLSRLSMFVDGKILVEVSPKIVEKKFDEFLTTKKKIDRRISPMAEQNEQRTRSKAERAVATD